ncbi:NADH oxidoreductase HCR [Pseudomonas fluorescens]|nr:NADH oxidoreductase HCR [Pseudomonas fluorescens]
MNTFAQSTTAQIWNNGRHLVRCVRTVQETHDVRTFSFIAEQPLMFFFKPGQFVTLELEIDGEPVMRSYTLASSPSLPYSFSLTIKRVPGGKVSNWLHDNLGEGDQLAVHGPSGQFNAIDFPADKVLLLSGGVGIIPVMSMARWFSDTNDMVDVVFVHSARTPKDIIYHRELRHMASRSEQFKLHLVCERYETGEAWAGYRGYFGRTMLDLMAPDFLAREIFCCGPTPYMTAVRQLLETAGFDMRRYHEEAFAPPPARVCKPIAEAPEQVTHLVAFSRSGKSVRVTPGETLHAAAGKLGLHIPKACGMGICGTCRVLKSSGEVVLEHKGGISDEELAQGYVLSCCSSPKGDVTIDY